MKFVLYMLPPVTKADNLVFDHVSPLTHTSPGTMAVKGEVFVTLSFIGRAKRVIPPLGPLDVRVRVP